MSSFGFQIVEYFNFQFERGEALENITQDVKKVLEEECDEESLRLLPKAVDTVRKKVSHAKMKLNRIQYLFPCLDYFHIVCLCASFTLVVSLSSRTSTFSIMLNKLQPII